MPRRGTEFFAVTPCLICPCAADSEFCATVPQGLGGVAHNPLPLLRQSLLAPRQDDVGQQHDHHHRPEDERRNDQVVQPPPVHDQVHEEGADQARLDHGHAEDDDEALVRGDRVVPRQVIGDELHQREQRQPREDQ